MGGLRLRRFCGLAVAAIAVALPALSAQAGGGREPAIKMTQITAEGATVEFEAGIRHASSAFVRLRDEADETDRVKLSRDGQTDHRGPRWTGSIARGGEACRNVAFIGRNKHGQDSRRYGRVCVFGSSSGSSRLTWTD